MLIQSNQFGFYVQQILRNSYFKYNLVISSYLQISLVEDSEKTDATTRSDRAEAEILLIERNLINSLKSKEKLEKIGKQIEKKKADRSKPSHLFIKDKNQNQNQVICHICGRKNFLNQETFILHCSTLHNVEFSSEIEILNSKFAVKKEVIAAPIIQRKRLIVGNTSKYVPEKFREQDGNYTHKWMIYIRAPPEDPNLDFIESVKVYLHDSFIPNHIVILNSIPFHVSRRGYGDFPVKVQIFFKNPKNKMVEIVHPLKLDRTDSGKEIISPETHVDLELNLTPYNPLTSTVEKKPTVVVKTEKKEEVEPVREFTTEEKIIKDFALKFPLFDKNELPYTHPKDQIEYSKWSIGKKKATEKLRAKHITSEIQKKYPNLKMNVQKVQSFIKKFANEQIEIPLEDVDTSISTTKKRKDLLPTYCKICGSAHRNHPDYEEKCKKKKLDSVKSINKNYNHILTNYHSPNSIDFQIDHPPISTKLDTYSINAMLSPIDVQIEPTEQQETELILGESLNCFVSSLVNDSLKILGPNENNEKVLVPTHVYTAIMNNFEKYAFLWNIEKN
eukprot:gene454-6865_t